MKFTSLQEYFYKLQNVLYTFILLPLLAFIFLIVKQPAQIVLLTTEEAQMVTWLLTGLIVMDFVAITFIFNHMMTKISKEIALSTKLDRYYKMTLVRFSVIMISSFLMVAGYYLTSSIVFVFLFGLGLILYLLLWPRPGAVCRSLNLRGDEREMVLYKKDKF